MYIINKIQLIGENIMTNFTITTEQHFDLPTIQHFDIVLFSHTLKQ